ncbi:hypothetical protein BEWA_026760 [Theileria equi strain WA]|uniref:Uncharacterized protein n=1 Tax=Theileria equi strain WA TaxID=1537102 RepID=L0AW51_THEEQ|nr:hypothetical protein BEWA_026760 [Theileria equi strain WA]AFZ79827.1 hypothetical protein BEWA_026760 [Theileria equi strain WA]|eukprot:XP_004829493.1 hypothetical protein BEWA_026760 [Theileria equi strain WA]
MSGKDKTVEIEISKRPENVNGVQKDKEGCSYEVGDGQVLLTDDWYPDPEGIYRRITHTPKDGWTISKIKNLQQNLNTFEGLEKHKSVSVYYWNSDYKKPLLIQLGTGDNDYYTTKNGDNNWNKSQGINPGTLREELDKQNCNKNNAHIIDLKEKDQDGNYNCPSGCNSQKINVSYSGNSYKTAFYSGRGYNFSVTSFKHNSSLQHGLPSLKDVREIRVYWYNSGKNPLLYCYEQSRKQRYFRKNSGTSNTWIEVSNASVPSVPYYPNLAIDFSKSSGLMYNGGGTDIKIAVLLSHIGDGYYRCQYSLRGGLFMVNSVIYSSVQLTEISPSTEAHLISVSGFYYGVKNPKDLPMPILIEFVIKDAGTTYRYYQKLSEIDDWKLLSRSGRTDQLVGEFLNLTLDKLKEFKDTLNKLNQSQAKVKELVELNKELAESSTTTIAGSSVGSGLGGAGLGALAMWKGPALIARLITRL